MLSLNSALIAPLPPFSQLAQRWGARRTPTGKVVWCELPLPPS